jgi:hypothetical protein
METCWAFCQWENHQTIGSYGKIWDKHGTKWVMRGCSWDDLKIKKTGVFNVFNRTPIHRPSELSEYPDGLAPQHGIIRKPSIFIVTK